MVTAHALSDGKDESAIYIIGSCCARRESRSGHIDSLDGVISHALEDDSGLSDSVDDCRQTGLGQDDVCGTTGGVGGTFDGDTDVGTR